MKSLIPDPQSASSPIRIPLTPLAAKIAEAAAIKRAMTDLLRELESQTNTSATWRHHPPAAAGPTHRLQVK